MSLTELETVPDVYSRFTWNADDVPDVEDPNQTFIQADFVEGGDTNLDNGIFNGNVVLLPWQMTVDERLVGQGKFSVVGLDNDYSTDPAGISGTFGGVPASCTIDLATFDVVC